jgi:hypothetical protein
MNTREKFLAELKAKKEAARTAEAEALSKSLKLKKQQQRKLQKKPEVGLKKHHNG